VKHLVLDGAAHDVGLFGSGKSPSGDRSFDLAPIAFIASRPSTFVVVEVRQERKSRADVTLPTGDVNGTGELAQRVGSEVSLSTWLKNVIRVRRVGSRGRRLQHRPRP
jgi:hypothetical protein